MAHIYSIALRIYGGVINGSLPKQPFASVGNVPDEFQPTPPTLVDEQQVWMITHTQDYTLYTSYSKRCYTAENQPGQMLICLFLPPQKRLAGGHSPLELLDAITDCFAVQGLRDGKLPNGLIDSSTFKVLLEKYRLEDRPLDLPVMQGREPSAFCVENKTQLDAIMRHSRYPVLSNVGRLELGFHCKSSIALMSKDSSNRSSNTSAGKTVKPEQPAKEQCRPGISGGLPLDVTPDEINHTSSFKKRLRITAITIGCIFCLYTLSGIIGMMMSDDDQPQAKADTVMVSTQEKTLEELEKNDTEETPLPIQAPDGNEAKQASKNKDIQPEEDPNKIEEARKAEELAMAKKKAEELMAKKRAEELEKQKEAKSAKWQSGIRQFAQSCPIQLRLGVRITSITFTPNSVTYVLSYEELSKYDLDSSDKNDIIADRSTVLKKYGVGLPADVKTNIIQKDKAGRNL